MRCSSSAERLRRVPRAAAALGRASHAVPTAAVTFGCVATGWSAGLPPGRLARLGAAVLTGQFSVGWLNDCLDAQRDAVAGRREKPTVTGALSARTLALATGGAAVATTVLSLRLGPRPAVVHLAGVGCGWAYDAGLKGTLVSPLPYAVAFALVPGVLVAATADVPVAPLVVAAGAALGAAAHFANTVADAEADARTQVRGLPQRVGPRGSAAVAAIGVGVGATLLVRHRPEPLVWLAGVAATTAAAVGAIRFGGGTPRAAGPVPASTGRRSWRAVLAGIGMLLGALVAVNRPASARSGR